MEADMEKPELIGIVGEQMETMTQRTMLRVNLQKQQKEAEEQITVLEGQLNRLKEYLAKIEGGLDVLDELE
jgi:vacuolar-type H+-ATPase subunit E/Vma4